MTVSDQIIQVLNELCAKFGIVIDWTSENVIPYVTTLCTKLISWEIWSSVAWMGIMVVLSIISIIFAIVLRKKLLDSIGFGDGVMSVIYTLFIVIWIVTVIVVSTQIFDIIKCYTFPEMFVFEYIKGLINDSK